MTPEEIIKEAESRATKLQEEIQNSDMTFADRMRLMITQQFALQVSREERDKEYAIKGEEKPNFYFSFCSRCGDTTGRKTNFCIMCGHPKTWDFEIISCECGATTHVCGKDSLFCGNCGKMIYLEKS